MKISEVCRLTGLTKKAIEYYQQRKIVNPQMNENGYRDFSEMEIDKLKQVSVYRSLGLAVSDIKLVLDSKFSKEELKRVIVKKNLENEISIKQIELLKKLSLGENVGNMKKDIEELNNQKTIKEKLLEMFPDFYGRFLISHFSKFLEEPIRTKEQEEAYKTIIEFLDKADSLDISDEIMDEFEEAMDFWTDEKLEEVEIQKLNSIENPEEFLEEKDKIIQEYLAFKETDEYKNSSSGKIMEAMKSFGQTSGYNDTFIPAMRKLSPSYEEYYKNLLHANEAFLENYPDNKL